MTGGESANVELIRRTNALFNQQKIDEALENTSEDFVMDWSNSIGPLKGVYEGRDGVRKLWSTFLEAWEEVHWEPQEFIEVDATRVVLINRVEMRGRGSGVPVTASSAQVWTIEEGVGRSITLYQSREEALAAAGA